MEEAAKDIKVEEKVEETVEVEELVEINMSDTNSAIDRLKELGDLKATGIISEEEFERMKKKILDEF